MMLPDGYSYKISPSILASDFTRLGEECQAVLDAGADWIHVDVMDGHFVPNLSFGLPILEALRKNFPNTFFDTHLMISNPDLYVEEYCRAGANMVTFHPEASTHPHRSIYRIKENGSKAGLAIDPGTPLSIVEELAKDLDMVLIMSVNPGFGGQSFIESTYDKLKRLVQIRDHRGASFEIEVDGGVHSDNISKIAEAGANVFVAGSAIFRTSSYKDTISHMREQLSSTHSL